MSLPHNWVRLRPNALCLIRPPETHLAPSHRREVQYVGVETLVGWLTQWPRPRAYTNPLWAMITLICEFQRHWQERLPLKPLQPGTKEGRQWWHETRRFGLERIPHSKLIDILPRDVRHWCGTLGVAAPTVNEVLEPVPHLLGCLWHAHHAVQRVNAHRASLEANPPPDVVACSTQKRYEALYDLARSRFLFDDIDPVLTRLRELWDRTSGICAVGSSPGHQPSMPRFHRLQTPAEVARFRLALQQLQDALAHGPCLRTRDKWNGNAPPPLLRLRWEWAGVFAAFGVELPSNAGIGGATAILVAVEMCPALSDAAKDGIFKFLQAFSGCGNSVWTYLRADQWPPLGEYDADELPDEVQHLRAAHAQLTLVCDMLAAVTPARTPPVAVASGATGEGAVPTSTGGSAEQPKGQVGGRPPAEPDGPFERAGQFGLRINGVDCPFQSNEAQPFRLIRRMWPPVVNGNVVTVREVKTAVGSTATNDKWATNEASKANKALGRCGIPFIICADNKKAVFWWMAVPVGTGTTDGQNANDDNA